MKKSHLFVTFLAIFVILTFLCFLPAYLLINCIRSFVDIDFLKSLWTAAAICIIFSLFFAILFFRDIRMMKESKFGYWMKRNYHRFFLSYIILNLFLVSFMKSAIWSYDEINDLLTLEWTIFGLAITIFLVWNVLIVEYLKKKQPDGSKLTNPLQKYELLLEKQSIYSEVEITFSTIVLLSINLILLLFSSYLTYIIHIPESIITQNVINCAFFFTIYTISILFFDILKPLRKDKQSLLKNNQVTMKELDTTKAEMVVHALYKGTVDAIQEMSDLSDDEKKQLSNAYVEAIRDLLLELTNKDYNGEKQSDSNEANTKK